MIGLYYRGVIAAELREYQRAFADFQKVINVTSTSDNNFVGQQTWLDKKIDMQNVGAYTLTRIYGLSDEDASNIKEAYCHIITGRYQECHDAIDRIFNYKKEPVAVYLKAVAFEHQGAHAVALEYYSRALKLDDQIADAYKKRGIYEQELKEWDKSLQDFTAVLKLYPDAFRINWIRGLSYYHMRRFQEAIADFNIYLKNDSTNKEVLGARGMAYLNSKEPLRAYADFAASDNLQGVNFNHVEKLVDSVLQLRDTAQALYALDIVTRKAPYFTEGFVQKFKIHMARDQWQVIADNLPIAMNNVRVDVPRSRHSSLLTIQALQYARNKQKDDAVKTFNEAIKVDNENAFAYLERGRLFLQMRKSSKAENDLKKALALGNEQAKEMLATIMVR
jgi:tetratricopeptide (TPR) repeat protein